MELIENPDFPSGGLCFSLLDKIKQSHADILYYNRHSCNLFLWQYFTTFD